MMEPNVPPAERPLQERTDHVMVPPPYILELAEDEDDRPEPSTPRRGWVRVTLVMIGLGWLGVFAIAVWLNPYQGGQVWREETHTQLGLPACNFKRLCGLPCPSCGMSTSFALLVRGDVVNSLKANFAGTMLAVIGMLYLPWSLLSMWRGRWLGFRRLEPVAIRLVFAFVAVMLLRWAGLLAWLGWSG